MKFNTIGIQAERNSQSVSDQARLLMSRNRQKDHNRQQSMLQRTASEMGIDA